MKFKVRVFLGEQEIPREDWKYLVINNKNVNRNVNAVADKMEKEHTAA